MRDFKTHILKAFTLQFRRLKELLDHLGAYLARVGIF
jgi:hypothetical protein